MRLAVESLWAMAEISSSVPAGLQLVPSPRRRFARKDLAWDYPGVAVTGHGGCLTLIIYDCTDYYSTCVAPPSYFLLWSMTPCHDS